MWLLIIRFTIIMVTVWIIECNLLFFQFCMWEYSISHINWDFETKDFFFPYNATQQIETLALSRWRRNSSSLPSKAPLLWDPIGTPFSWIISTRWSGSPSSLSLCHFFSFNFNINFGIPLIFNFVFQFDQIKIRDFPFFLFLLFGVLGVRDLGSGFDFNVS